jgi:hypothetical protein
MKRSSVYSTSLIGSQTDTPSWVKTNQSSVFLSGFFNDLPNRINTATATPVSGIEGMMLFNKSDKRLYVYADQEWHIVGGETSSNQGSFLSFFLIGVHKSPEAVTLTHGGASVPSSDNTFRILASESAILEGDIVIQLLGGTDTRSCKFHVLITRGANGPADVSQPILFRFSDPKPNFEVNVDEAGLVLLKVTISDASSGRNYTSVAHCSMVKIG